MGIYAYTYALCILQHTSKYTDNLAFVKLNFLILLYSISVGKIYLSFQVGVP